MQYFIARIQGAKNISLWLIEKLNTIVRESCGIDNLVVTVEKPSIQAAQEMMNHPKVPLLVITGGTWCSSSSHAIR